MPRFVRVAFLSVAAVLLLLVCGASQAAASHVACGDTITADTTLDSDLTNCPDNGLVIGASNITLDLNGHTIDGDGVGFDAGVENFDTSAGRGYRDVTVRNGTVQQFATGVGVLNTFGNIVLRSLSVTGCGVGIGLLGASDLLIEDNSISGNGTGIDLDLSSNGNRIIRNTISGNGTGIHTHGALIQYRPRDNRILQNRILGNDGDGILLALVTGATRVEGNIASGNGDDGIDADEGEEPNLLGANSANDNGDLGIEAVPSAIDLGGNQAQGNGNAARCTNIACDNTGRPLFGRRVSGASFSAMTGGAKRASVFPVYFSGTVNKLTAFLDGGGAASGSQVLRAVIYERAAGGGPGALVARSFQATVAAGRPPGWLGFYFPFPPRLQAGIYWLGIQSGQQSGVARFSWDSVPGSRWFNIDDYADGPSNPFGASPVDDQQMAIYASGSY